MRQAVSEEMITAGLRAWFGSDGPFFTAAKSLQRDYMRQALEAALDAATAGPAIGPSHRLDEPNSQASPARSALQALEQGEGGGSSVARVDMTPPSGASAGSAEVGEEG